jgi:hypothetical protein
MVQSILLATALFLTFISPATPSVGINTTSPLAAGAEGVMYSQALTASGGAAPYLWSLSGGSLPPGVILNADGSIAGIPTAPGNFEFSAKVADSQGSSDTRNFAVTTKPASAVPKITTKAALPDAIVGTSYAQEMTASGGSGDYAWVTSDKTVPPGLVLEAAGNLTGTPTAQGAFTFTINVTDSQGTTGKKDFSLTVKATPH